MTYKERFELNKKMVGDVYDNPSELEIVMTEISDNEKTKLVAGIKNILSDEIVHIIGSFKYLSEILADILELNCNLSKKNWERRKL